MKFLKNNIHLNRAKILRKIPLILLDGAVFALTSFLALWMRLDFSLDSLLQTEFLFNVLKLLPASIPVAVILYMLFGLYNSLWIYAGEREMARIAMASVAASLAHFLLLESFGLSVPRSFPMLQTLLLMFLTLLSRFSYRFARRMREKSRSTVTPDETRKTMLIGAGRAGETILRELQQSRFSANRVVCIVDDDKNKVGHTMYGVPVAGTTEDIETLAEQYGVEEIIFSIPSASERRRSEILNICSKTNCKLRTLPGIYQLVNGKVGVQNIREVQIEDLLFRKSLNLSNETEYGYYTGKTVLVTGGGGSIGSEICRQIAKCHPNKLIIFDIYENNAYDIQQELAHEYGESLNLSVEIGSVRDRQRLEGLFSQHKPNIVFHAAAHKHVPLMEHSSSEAIQNNVFGTYNTADMAEKYHAEKFILLSTDKAVNPTNIMGATKRLCEMVIQSRCDSKTCFAAVRFGNVLGSNGSVIPLFKRQIAAGGPITLTDKRIIRYFMTIPEATQLVIEAGAAANHGELFVLDMGKPVRIYDLAVNMIKLSGLKPDVDIKIEEIGLRPGEKLYEELLIKTENLDKTDNDLIFIERDTPLSRREVDEKLKILSDAVKKTDGVSGLALVRDAIKATVPTFREPEEINKIAESSDEMKKVMRK